MASLLEQWRELIESQTEETFEEFWKEYSDAEIKIYDHILSNPEEKMTGKLVEKAEEFGVRPIIFMGFLDGVNDSIKNKNDIENMDENSEFEVEIIPETLFYNMLAVDADHLYSLEKWQDVLGIDKMKEIAHKYRASKTVRRESPKIGRNDPCPCGSGKKYKHCCGKN